MKSNFAYKPYEIIKKETLTSDTVLFSINGKMPFIPGQFVQVSLDHFGEGTFAVCSNPENQKTFDLCIRGCGGLTNHLVNAVPGDTLDIRGPYGKGCWPTGKILEKEVLLVAGGMGIVPLRPLVYQLLKYRDTVKKLYFVSGFRSEEHILFADDYLKWKDDKKFDRFIGIAEHANKGFWGEKGMITEGLEKIEFNPKKTIVLMCGPDIMYKFCNEILLKKGIAEENIYISFERRMECGIGVCQHCNVGKYLVCKDGPVFSYANIKDELDK